MEEEDNFYTDSVHYDNIFIRAKEEANQWLEDNRCDTLHKCLTGRPLIRKTGTESDMQFKTRQEQIIRKLQREERERSDIEKL